MRRCTIALVLLLALVRPAQAEIYHVTTTGNNGNSGLGSTPSTAWLQIGPSVEKLSAGDTLYIHAGTYIGAFNYIDDVVFEMRSGINLGGGAITVAAFGDGDVVIRAPNLTSGIGLTQDTAYWVFQGLIIDVSLGVDDRNHWNDNIGIYIGDPGVHHIRFLDVEVKNARGFCVDWTNANGGDAQFLEFIGGSIHHCGVLEEYSSNGHGIYMETGNNIIRGVEIYNCYGYGIHAYEDGLGGAGQTVSNNVFDGNNIHHNGRTTGEASAGIVVAWGVNNVIKNNVIHNNTYGGIQPYTNTNNTQVYNNTVYGNSVYGINIENTNDAPIVRNNIVYNNGSTIAGTYYNGVGNVTVGSDAGANFFIDPEFTNAGTFDFTLQMTSDAIDAAATIAAAGADYAGIGRPQGPAYDYGAYEYDAGTPVDPPPTGTPTLVRLRLRIR